MSETTSSFVLYQAEDGQVRVQCRLEDQTVWLTQRAMAELYQIGVGTVNHHLKAVYAEGELAPEATIRRYRIVQSEGSREIGRPRRRRGPRETACAGVAAGGATSLSSSSSSVSLSSSISSPSTLPPFPPFLLRSSVFKNRTCSAHDGSTIDVRARWAARTRLRADAETPGDPAGRVMRMSAFEKDCGVTVSVISVLETTAADARSCAGVRIPRGLLVLWGSLVSRAESAKLAETGASETASPAPSPRPRPIRSLLRARRHQTPPPRHLDRADLCELCALCAKHRSATKLRCPPGNPIVLMGGRHVSRRCA
jgi:hypothetical protein